MPTSAGQLLGQSVGRFVVSQVMQQVRGSTETPIPLKEVCQLLLFGTTGIPIFSMPFLQEI